MQAGFFNTSFYEPAILTYTSLPPSQTIFWFQKLQELNKFCSQSLKIVHFL